MSIRRILLLFLLLTPQVAGAESDDERQLFDFLNVERQRESLPSLQWEDELHDIASKHSKEMAEQGQISHTGEGEHSRTIEFAPQESIPQRCRRMWPVI